MKLIRAMSLRTPLRRRTVRLEGVKEVDRDGLKTDIINELKVFLCNEIFRTTTFLGILLGWLPSPSVVRLPDHHHQNVLFVMNLNTGINSAPADLYTLLCLLLLLPTETLFVSPGGNPFGVGGRGGLVAHRASRVVGQTPAGDSIEALKDVASGMFVSSARKIIEPRTDHFGPLMQDSFSSPSVRYIFFILCF